jgi:bifunctional DNA-binding transcriptional regulator/antitoxin component of YhaV-PrlF toxin-antitoxin module
MVRTEHSIQFDVEVDDNGNVVLPASVVERLGSKLHLRLTSEKLNAALIQRMVTEEEVERIGRIQLVSCAGNSFTKSFNFG